MTTFLIILDFLVIIKLISIASLQVSGSDLSVFELERRASHNDEKAKETLKRNGILADINALQRIFTAIFLALSVILSVAAFGWFLGVIISFVVALEYNAVAKLNVVSKWAHKLYKGYKIEDKLAGFIKTHPQIMKVLRGASDGIISQLKKFDSRQELQYMVSNSVGVLSADEKAMIINGLSFNERTVDSIMTPRSMVKSIKKDEFLGPLVLDDLHKLGHSRLPVIDGDIDHVIGILYLKDLLALDVKKSNTAEKTMEPKVYYIRGDQDLSHALAAFLKTHHHLFVVINDLRETIGIITIEDVIEALLGRKIIDEFDAHDDIRLVALRSLKLNNSPKKREDV